MKTEENASKTRGDSRLTNACKYGFTVIFDVFNRARPEAKNVLLCILEKRLLDLPSGWADEDLLRVHTSFRAILTSNSEEYAGFQETQDALLDRMITIAIGPYDRETEVRITAAKSSLDLDEAARIVDVVREVRELGVLPLSPNVRACIMIAKVIAIRRASVVRDDRIFLETCRDVLRINAVRVTREGVPTGDTWFEKIVARHCPSESRGSPLRRFDAASHAVNGHLTVS
jgi:gas vesicle protein GvpN